MCIMSLIYILYILFVVVFLRSWIFNQPTLSILHFVPWKSMCDAQCCQEMTPFTKNHLQKVKNIYYYLLIVPFLKVACSS